MLPPVVTKANVMKVEHKDEYEEHKDEYDELMELFEKEL
jgi:hypothetical protein